MRPSSRMQNLMDLRIIDIIEKQEMVFLCWEVITKLSWDGVPTYGCSATTTRI
jgi:hypothetical protein